MIAAPGLGLHSHRETMALLLVPYDPTGIAGETVSEHNVTVAGVLFGDFVVLQRPLPSGESAILQSRVSSSNTMQVQWVKPSALSHNPSPDVYPMLWIRNLPVVASLEDLLS